MAVTDVLNRPLRIHHLTFLDNGDEVTVGRLDIDEYVHLPADGAALLRRLSEGETPARAADWYAAEYGETVDMADFIDAITELGFVAGEAEPVAEAAPVRWQRLGKAVFSIPAMAVYASILVAAVVVCVRRPELLPYYRHSFFSTSLVAVTVGLFLGQFPLILLHESAHALAGRRLGLPTRLRISRRMFYVVMETALNGLVTVPRSKRFLPIIAGAATDLLVAASLTLVAAFTGGLVSAICLAFALTTLMRLLWQCYFFLRTDLYYLVVTILGCTNLHAVSRNLLHRRIARLLRLKAPPETPGSAVDHRAARWYSWLLLVGYLAMAFSVITVAVPSTAYVVIQVVQRIAGHAPFPMILDSTVVAVLILSQFFLAGYLSLRERRRARR